ncbi:type II secretion system protein GspD [Deinococcus sp. Arct2-2]|uniref:type II secretion system protein GspD n=1 Tax=Deinococcus sp. Arct2-2 TaxID=2568653 RepID=UPI0010A33FC4|nr:secretin N-terminal domain-containing protein [Deinococcus sp. Arct2-2]THF68535.1 type II secretion system protein GspD [Deinococcus sp. Arct2-2]
MFRRSLTLALLLNLSAALAAPTPVTVIRAGDTIVIQGSEQLRYQTDPLTRRLVLPDVVLAPGATIPEGLSWQKADGTIQFVIPDGTTYALSPDGRSLILTPPLRQAVSPIPQDERAPIVYPLSFADPSTVAGLLQSLYPGTRVVIDQRQRTLIVVANPADRSMLLALLKQLDASRPQVQFEAEILEVNRDTTDSLGIQYDSIFTFKLAEGEGGGLLNLGAFGRSPLSLSLGINLLKTNGAARVLARPRITTIDGLEARINSTQTTPVVTATSNGGTSVQSITTGITLRLTPKVAPDGTVETSLTISVSVPTGTTSQGVPQFSTREATTTVRVGNGEPIAIGGLLEDRTVTGTQKVPFLGDIPVLGKLFSTTRTDTRRSDLIIVVTPRLVMSPNEAPTTQIPGEGLKLP